MINDIAYRRGFLEWGIGYTFPWRDGDTATLRLNLNSPSFREDRKHWRFYVGNISHEEVDIQIFRIGGKEAWEGWHSLMMGTMKHVPKRVKHPFSYTGFLTEKALDSLPKKYFNTRKKKAKI